MLAAVPKTVFSVLAASGALKRLASRYGMRNAGSFARRFVAGESLGEAIAASRTIEAQGLTVTLDLLGEGVSSVAAAAEATAAYIETIAEVERAGVSRNISIKLTQLGLDVDRATSVDNIRRVIDAAARAGVFVRIDMEGSAYTERTFDTFRIIWDMGCRHAGMVIQSCLRRSAGDVRRLIEMGARVRLVKGAYREPRAVAWQHKTEVDAAYVDLMRDLLDAGTYPAIATHDPAMIAMARDLADRRGLAKDEFEFQMLYGVRRDLQASLVADGYRVRVYVPFGREWYPYFMRRLGERPANVGFVVRSVLRDKGA